MNRPSEKKAEERAIAWLARLNASNLSEAEEEEFSRWLESSPLHQVAYIKAEKLWERGEVFTQGKGRESSGDGAFGSWRLPELFLGYRQAWATASVLVLIFGFWAVTTYDQRSEIILQTAVGEHKDVELKDGSRIELNTNSQILVAMSADKRQVELSQGEAFFNVAADKNRPFEVHTRFGIVRVLGTRFAVRQTELDTIVTVEEGKVSLLTLEPETESHSGTLAVIKANQRLSMNKAALGQAARKVDAATVLAWRSRTLIFRGAPLSEVIREIDRYIPEKIFLGEESLKTREITAVIKTGNAKAIVESLEKSLSLRAVYTQENTIILSEKAQSAPDE